MSKAIFVSFPRYGHIIPTLGLAAEMVRQGETVVYYSTEKYSTLIESTGAIFKNFEIKAPPGDAGRRDSSKDIPVYEPDPKADPMLVLYQDASFHLDSVRVRYNGYMEEFAAEKADYFIHDAFLFGNEVTRALDIPAISSVTNFRVGEKIIETNAGAFIKSIIGVRSAPMLEKYDNKVLRRMLELTSVRLRALLGTFGYDMIDLLTGREKLNIYYSSKQFQMYPDSFDSSYCFVGRCMHEFGDGGGELSGIKDDKPLVYISLGTIFNHHSDTFIKFIDAFKGTPFNVLLSVGDSIEMESLGDIPENIAVKRFVPQMEVLKKASVFITHGGANSVHEAAWMNVPVVVVPQSVDQFLGAETVEKLKAGIYLKGKDYTPADIREAVTEVFGNRVYKDNMASIGESLKAAGGAQKAWEAIVDFKKEMNVR